MTTRRPVCPLFPHTLLALGLLLPLACQGKGRSDDARPAPTDPGPDPQVDAAKPRPTPREPALPPGNLSGTPDLVKAGPGDVAPQVKAAAEQARSENRRLLVYVGASWCEPCTRFKDALEAGTLDPVLPGLRFMEFDMDVDQQRLSDAGYSSRYIPIFAIPGPDGRSGALMQGGIKGKGAVDNLTGRLRQLLAQNP